MATKPAPKDLRIAGFVTRVLQQGAEHYRDFPWRQTRYPYAILVSEVMLQQTQAGRVVDYYERWLGDFPTLEALAGAPLEAVLQAWRGLGYNRRAIALKRAAEQVVSAGTVAGPRGAAVLPRSEEALRALPGVGPATAAGVLAFAFDEPAAYLETNVRAVVLHELFADADGVSDREILPLVAQAAVEAAGRGVDARTWNYALLDYGTHLKRTLPNPSRRSAHHARQSRFEGSRRQKRARLLRAVMDAPGMRADNYADALGDTGDLGSDEAATIANELLRELELEGFLACEHGRFRIA